jgi:hypothetical protein
VKLSKEPKPDFVKEMTRRQKLRSWMLKSLQLKNASKSDLSSRRMNAFE